MIDISASISGQARCRYGLTLLAGAVAAKAILRLHYSRRVDEFSAGVTRPSRLVSHSDNRPSVISGRGDRAAAFGTEMA